MSAGDLALPLMAHYIGIFGAGFVCGAILGSIVGAFTNLTHTMNNL